MTQTMTDVGAIPEMRHQEAMALGRTEGQRLLDVVDQLSDQDWSKPTDCEGWDVKALLSHVLGSMEANSRTREFVRQYHAAVKASKRSGMPMIDEMTALHVRDHSAVVPQDIARRLREIAPSAIRGRSRMPRLVRAVPFKPGPPFQGSWKVGYLVGTIMNRDYWMHRVDLTRATGTELVLTAEHDGRLVADVVSEWARGHREPFTLTLDGPAGGIFVQGDHGDDLRLDAVEFCRVLSGRSVHEGLLNQGVPF
jgi:uncharacterized protein (TIGR03083 family)